ncbi:MAG: 30S ribosomal protein S20 [Mycoplasmoidaceae bacterium]|nr:30S ribosomal protein S20 [Mycoplasmoidaceae bacterium]
MANIKSNIKTKRQSDKRHAKNAKVLSGLKNNIKKVRSTKDKKDLNKLYSNADSLSRKRVIHRNKANRIKSRNAKAMNKAAKK